jgi:hypothetical protein
MELGTIALVITGVLMVVGSLSGYKMGKTKVDEKLRQAGEVFTATKEAFEEVRKAFADDTVTEEELAAIKKEFEEAWTELQELLGLKEEPV